MYFPFFILHQRNNRSAIHPQTIYSEVPYIIRPISFSVKRQIFYLKTGHTFTIIWLSHGDKIALYSQERNGSRR